MNIWFSISTSRINKYPQVVLLRICWVGLFKNQNNPRNKPAAIKALQNPRREGHQTHSCRSPAPNSQLLRRAVCGGGKHNFICPGCLPLPPDSPQNSGFWSSPQGPAPPALFCHPPFIPCVCSGGGGLPPMSYKCTKNPIFPLSLLVFPHHSPLCLFAWSFELPVFGGFLFI